MLDRPTPRDILRAVAEFLRTRAVPALPDRQGFEARVAANALDLVIRQLDQKEAGEAAELDRLTILLGETGSLDSLNRLLADRLRSGALALDIAGLADHLRATCLEKLRVDQPRYASYVRAVADNDADNEQKKV